MDWMPSLGEDEIRRKIESVIKKEVKIVTCEEKSGSEVEEKLLINGFPVGLEGNEGYRIKTALLAGIMPPCALLNNILFRAGILKHPVQLETIMSVKSTTRTKELVAIRDHNGILLNERTKETEEHDQLQSSNTELWKTQDFQGNES